MEDWIKEVIILAVGGGLATAAGTALKIYGRYVGDYFVGRTKSLLPNQWVAQLSEKWETKWYADGHEEYTDTMVIKQSGPFITGHATGKNINYSIKAELDRERNIQGSWKTEQKGKFWKGNFYLHLYRDGEIRGKWAGQLGKSDKVGGGDWVWKPKR